MRIDELNAMLQKPKPQNCNKCGRKFSDCGGTASRVDPKKYHQTDRDADKYCTACFYEFNAGYHGRDEGC